MADGFFPVGVPLEVTQTPTPGVSPLGATNALYPKSDDNWYTMNSAGVEKAVGSGNALYSFFMGC